MSLITARPQSIGGVLDAGIQLFRAGFRACLPLIVAYGLLLALITLGTALVMPNEPGAGLVGGWLLLPVGILLAVTVLLVWLMMIARLHSAAGGTVDGSVAAVLARAPVAVIAMLLWALAMMVGFLLLIVPGLYLIVALWLTPVLVIIERLGPMATLSRSFQLVRGHWWRTALLIFMITVIFVILSFVGELFSAAVSFLDLTAQGGSTMVLMAVAAVLSGLVAGVAQVYYLAATLAVYYDLRVRHEGADLESRIVSMAGA